MRPHLVFGALMIATLGAPLTPPAAAQIFTRHMFRDLDKADVDTLRPLVQQALNEDPVGHVRRWDSPSGKRGALQLIEGGVKAGATTGTVKIVLVRSDSTTKALVFRYQQDAKGQWRTVG
ncbi:hypothetical protein ACFB49_47080 [Sphingomonas sp. DBB INV C78]|uniref:hypothetical protein n=1 Tax=Sphingomonas sp. DBB INV C78 TaxID=3349434 RepID=UPI0036D2637C